MGSQWKLLAVLLFAAVQSRVGIGAPADGVDYNREVRPILGSKCFQCHGPDDKTRKAKLRLDVRSAALLPAASGQPAIVPGNPAKSELVVRICSTEPNELMPPAKTGKPLSANEIALLKRWIEQGAKYAEHWAFVKSVRPAIPPIKNPSWAINPIDNFIAARLDKESLKPAPSADRFTLARRVAIDLTGLPPTLEEVDRFVGDTRPDAYERYVDQMLAKPAYGERWAQTWLDLARYADSQGYANDPDRTIWRWRDWVIQAYNDNMPYDRFTLEQLAGDLLPNAGPAQQMATGFHRNTLTNTEGGTSPEEFRSAAIVDRVNTTFQVWTGLTMACAQCHSHKYDPFSQKDYFRLYAILNNCEDANNGDDSPNLTVPVVGKDKELADVTSRLEKARKSLADETTKVDAAQGQWEKTVDPHKLPAEIRNILNPSSNLLAKELLPRLKGVGFGVPVPLFSTGPAKNQLPRLQEYHRSLSSTWSALNSEVKDLASRQAALQTLTPVLRELKQPRVTHIQIRGNFQDKGDQVTPGLPEAIPSAPVSGPIDRLALARWLVSPDHPLTARVAVNRLWEELFGTGLVLTSEDFGTQGEPPSHPELLDWLATEYVSLGWDTKKMLKLMVLSATYRQGSQVDAELARRDPLNRLLARGPRVRLSGEAVRDQALFTAGLLSPKMYGPPVQPPRPNFGLSAAFGSSTDWQSSTGEDRYRRALYTRWRRNAPYPSLTTFDAPERTTCNIRRIRTNTPLQALVTLNDPVYIEAAQGLARRTMTLGGATPEERIRFAFRTVLTRPPSEVEMQRLASLFEQARSQYLKEPAQAADMATKPLGAAPKDLNLADLAAWTVVANVLLNLDETLVKR